MCLVEGCQKKLFSMGMCQTHYNIKRTANMPPCSVDGCDAKSKTKGLCGVHYRRGIEVKRDFCSIDGCTNKIHANKLCSTHHTRLRRHGSLSKVRPKNWSGTDKEYDAYYRKAASRSLKRKYGITLYDYEVMYEEQNGVCKICGNPETRINPYTKTPIRMPVDHCHETGKIRGLLCTDCNVGIGNLNDDIKLLEKAIEYLHNAGKAA